MRRGVMLEISYEQLELLAVAILFTGAVLARWFPVWMGRLFRRHFQPVYYESLSQQIVEEVLRE
jgi:hypothetical protein